MKLVAIALLSFYLFSCGGNSNSIKKEISKKDSTLIEKPLKPIKKDTFVSKQAEIKENSEKIEAKYGEQWDFCSCVVRVDSITDAFEKNPTEAQQDKIMARWEYIDTKCKALTTFDQTNPDQRTIHERKVRKCLKAAGLKK